MKVLNKFFLLAFLAVGVVSLAQGAEPIGRVVKLRGDVESFNKTSGDSKKLQDGAEIFEGDLLKSQKGSFAKILMKDDTIFQLGPDTELAFEEFKFRSKKDRTASYNLVKGQLRSLFTVKSPSKSLKIKTPNASMGIRGTEILSDVYKYKGEVKTDIALLSGELEVDIKKLNLGEALRNRMITLKPGQVFESNHFKKNFTGGKPISKLIQKLPRKIFNQLRASQKKGGQTFLFEARKEVRRDIFNNAKFNFKRDGSDEKELDKKDGIQNSGRRNEQPSNVKVPEQSNRQLPSGVKPPVVIRNNGDFGGGDGKREEIGVSSDEMDRSTSPKKRRELEQKRRSKDRKEQERAIKNKRMGERKRQAQARREEMIRLRQQQLALMRQEEIKKIIFGRFSQWRDGLSNLQQNNLREQFGDITPAIFCRLKPDACKI